jgi:hypothetical protein
MFIETFIGIIIRLLSILVLLVSKTLEFYIGL